MTILIPVLGLLILPASIWLIVSRNKQRVPADDPFWVICALPFLTPILTLVAYVLIVVNPETEHRVLLNKVLEAVLLGWLPLTVAQLIRWRQYQTTTFPLSVLAAVIALALSILIGTPGAMP